VRIDNNYIIQTLQQNKIDQTHDSKIFTKRIGSTNYRVSVHFSKTGKETMNDKILRLIKNETANGKVVDQ
jgi:hypothetical protein